MRGMKNLIKSTTTALEQTHTHTHSESIFSMVGNSKSSRQSLESFSSSRTSRHFFFNFNALECALHDCINLRERSVIFCLLASKLTCIPVYNRIRDLHIKTQSRLVLWLLWNWFFFLTVRFDANFTGFTTDAMRLLEKKYLFDSKPHRPGKNCLVVRRL